jgi:chromosome condensin MukBEF MukE localization factor
MSSSNIHTDFSLVLVSLLRGVVYREDHPDRWQILMEQQTKLRDYLSRMGLEAVIYEDEGYAFLRNQIADDQDEAYEIPRLISRRALSYPVSLLLALLRRSMAEHDASSSEVRIILDRQDVLDMVSVYFSKGNNEVQYVKKIDSYLNRIQEMGFIRFIGENKDKIEIKRILKAFVDAQWLNEFDAKLAEYTEYGKRRNG